MSIRCSFQTQLATRGGETVSLRPQISVVGTSEAGERLEPGVLVRRALDEVLDRLVHHPDTVLVGERLGERLDRGIVGTAPGGEKSRRAHPLREQLGGRVVEQIRPRCSRRASVRWASVRFESGRKMLRVASTAEVVDATGGDHPRGRRRGSAPRCRRDRGRRRWRTRSPRSRTGSNPSSRASRIRL